MNHLVRVILTVGLSFAAVLILLLNAPSAQPDRRQQAVLAYVSFKRATMAQPLTAGQYVLASMPQNFRPAEQIAELRAEITVGMPWPRKMPASVP